MQVDRIAAEVAGWPGASVDPRSYGGQEFLLGTEPFGYLHADRLIDVPLPEAIRSALIDGTQPRAYRRSPNPKWLLFPIDTAADADHSTMDPQTAVCGRFSAYPSFRGSSPPFDY